MRRTTFLALALSMVLACGSEDAPEEQPPTAVGPGGRIAFLAIRQGRAELCLVRPDGSGLTRIADAAPDGGPPVWSPDGASLAFTAIFGGGRGVCLVSSEGGDPRRITPPEMHASMPSFAPDGKTIAFVETKDLELSILTVAVGGGRTTRLEAGMGPAWSRDGGRVFFTQGNLPQLMVMNADGTESRPFFPDSLGLHQRGFLVALLPVPSPGGERVLFTGTVLKTGGGGINQEVFTARADGTGLRRLTEQPGADFGWGWSPDGERIVFSSERDGDSELYLMRSDGTGVERVTDSDAKASFAAWSPR